MTRERTDHIAEISDRVLDAPTDMFEACTESSLHTFTELYLKYRRPKRRFLSSRVPDPATADDLTAQVFLKALTSIESYRAEGTHRAWLFQIARNSLANWRLEKARLQIPVENLPDAPGSEDAPTVTALAREEQTLIWDTVAELPEAQREIVRLRYWKDLTIEEIARVTGRTSGSIRALLHRSRQSMAERLNAKDVTVILGATGAASLALYSVHRQRRRTQ